MVRMKTAKIEPLLLKRTADFTISFPHVLKATLISFQQTYLTRKLCLLNLSLYPVVKPEVELPMEIFPVHTPEYCSPELQVPNEKA